CCDDRMFYAGRDRALEVIVDAGGEIRSAQKLSEILDLRFPLNLAKVLKYAVIVTGTRSPAASPAAVRTSREAADRHLPLPLTPRQLQRGGCSEAWADPPR